MNNNTALNELLYFCQENSSVGALMLSGDWGCGKTHLIDKVLKEELKKNQEGVLIRVSLFGLKSAEEIHNAVRKAFMQTLMDEKGLSKQAGALASLKSKLSGLFV